MPLPVGSTVELLLVVQVVALRAALLMPLEGRERCG